MVPLVSRSASVLLLAILGGCTGEITGAVGSGETGGAGTAGVGGSGTDVTNWIPGERGDPNAVAVLPLRVLTRSEYDNTISLVFGEEYGLSVASLRAASVLPGETYDLSGFLSVGEISEVNVLRYMDAAKTVAGAVSSSLPRLFGCDLAATPNADACVRAFVESFGELLYRRPLVAAEVDEHLAFYQHERTTLGRDANGAALQLLEAMLQSPYFLYRWEQGFKVVERKGDAAKLNPYQVASRLSFFLWGSGPDRALLAQAKAGTLATSEQVAEAARRMLESPRAERALESFHEQWLGLSHLDSLFKDEKRFPQWNDELRSSMKDEVQAFTRHVILKGDGAVSSLLGAPYSFVNASLASVYGISGVQGSELRQVQLDPRERAGLLTMPALLASASEASVANPFKRGKLILEKLLCQKLEPPPVVPPLPTPDQVDPKPQRQVLETMTSVAPCSACHVSLNPLGFGLGNFDAIGKFQTLDDAGFPVDASGTLPGGAAFSGPSELSMALTSSEEVRTCITKQWFRFGFGRAESPSDAFSLDGAYTAFQATDFNIRELLVAFVTTRSFLHRQIETGEVVE